MSRQWRKIIKISGCVPGLSAYVSHPAGGVVVGALMYSVDQSNTCQGLQEVCA